MICNVKMFKFFGPSNLFSNWYQSKYNLDGKTFFCVEQGFMYEKAILFGDTTTANQILTTPYDPKTYKALGRRVSNFDEKTWQDNREDFMFRHVYARVSQNSFLRKALLETKDKIIVEASPFDKIWGIGLYASDSRSDDPSTWRGLNLLGKVYMKVRQEILEE